MPLTATERVDVVNIGLMILSCCVAFLVPFELFLFSYAVLGPLHYLTEISWLHDHQYYTKGRRDALILLGIGALMTLDHFNRMYGMELGLPEDTFISLAYVAFLGSLVLAFVKHPFYRIAGLVLVALTFGMSQHFKLFFAIFLPTLVHVYVFTGLFMLYGALKSKSRTGLLAVGILMLCPVALFVLFPDANPVGVTAYGQEAYVGGKKAMGFIGMHVITLHEFFGYPDPNTEQTPGYWMHAVFGTRGSILLARFIAFAYTYHYLNWFSKTRVIQWHKVPKARFAVVIAIWIISVVLYIYDYAVGLQWLFFLSFLHVLLEFPLNHTSMIGIGRVLSGRFRKQGMAVADVPRK
jgi:hypothetical protein